MSNSFWNYTVQLVANTLAKAEDVAASLSGIQTGFDAVESDTLKSIKVTDGTAVVDINLNAAARSLKILTFNADGDIVAVDDMGTWRGNAAVAAGTAYNERDLVKDATGSIGLNNIYRANTSFTNTGPMAGDAANWDLVVDVAEVTSAAADAASSAAAALVSEDAAAATYILFTGQYYGSRTTAQETNLDPNGSASTTGDLYFDSTLNRMKVFNGSAWILTTANAVDVALTDAGGYYVTDDAEFALQQNGLQLSKIEVNTKLVDLGTWDMVANSSTVVAHNLTYNKIRNISVSIRSDADSFSRNLTQFDPSYTVGFSIVWDSTNVTIVRPSSFNNTQFDTMGDDGNRGWMIIDYID